MLRHGPLGERSVHLCVDMQNLFLEETAWEVPWMARVLPEVHRLVAPRPERTVFTRFIPAREPGKAAGAWRRYYEKWAEMTLLHAGGKIDLAPPLRVFAPPALVVDKRVYSPWMEGALRRRLMADGIDTVVISGGETDVCVLATVLGAIDLGYRVVIAADALCSSSDKTHDALMVVYSSRFSEQVEVASVDEILDAWR